MTRLSIQPWRGRFFRRIFTRVGLLLTTGILVVCFITWEIMQTRLDESIDQQLRNNAQLAQIAIGRGWPFATPDDLASACREIRRATDLRTTVIDPLGVVMADSDADASQMENHAHRPEVEAAVRGRIGTDRRQSATVRHPFIYVAAPMHAGGRLEAIVRVAAPAEDIQRREAAIIQSIGIALAVSLPLSLLIAGLLARRLARPVQRVSGWAQRLATGDLETRLEFSAGDEIGRVAESLERMRVNLAARVREVQQRRQDLEVTLSHLEEGVIAVDDSGIVLTANESAHRLLALEESLMHSPLAARLDHLALRALWSEARSSDGRELRRDVALDGPGPARTLSVTITRVTETHSPIEWLVCLRDITALARAAAMKTDFVANASHELRTPVASIRAAVETLRTDGLDANRRRQFISLIERNVDRLQTMTEDLMHLNRVESAHPELSIGPFDVEDVFASMRASFADIVRRRGIRLSFTSDVLECTTDQRWLELILKNLIDNAVKFTADGGGVDVRCRAEADRVCFEVRDEGCGIPAEDLERVFERFYQVDKSRSLNVGGTGLGLAIVKHAVHALGGEVVIESEVERGTMVGFWLPMAMSNV